jgi:simple sugar transport system permease protein
MNHGITVAILSSGVALMVPILWAALGEVINEKAGVLNIGIEGVMLFGAAVAALVFRGTHSFLLAGLAAIPTGLLCGAVLSYLYVRRGTDQIVTGLMFNLAALGLTTILYEKFLTGAGQVTSLGNISIPLLRDIPIAGPVLFEQKLLVYLAIVAAAVIFYLLRRSWFGVYITAVGEKPLVADTAGLDVYRLRSAALLASCVLVAIGGATIIITQSPNFLPGITGGQGFIALAVVVLGRFHPGWIVGGAALFGVSTALQYQAQNIGWAGGVPSQVWLALPYVATIVAVVLAKHAQYPAATAEPYSPPGTAKT